MRRFRTLGWEKGEFVEVDLSTTLKPSGRFVLLHHCFPPGTDPAREDHFDLMLEQESGLATWAIPALPAIGQSVSAKRLPDHRKHYLDYEGPISNDRGSVTRRLSGKYAVLPSTNETMEVRLDSGQDVLCLVIESTTADETKVTGLEPNSYSN